MKSLAKKITELQNDFFSISENLKSLLKLGLPPPWKAREVAFVADDLIETITMKLRKYISLEKLDLESNFYDSMVKSKKVLVREEKRIVRNLENMGYKFIYSNSGKDLEAICGLKFPRIEDCLSEKDKLLLYGKNLEKIYFFICKIPTLKTENKNELKSMIDRIQRMRRTIEIYISDCSALEKNGEYPRMEVFFSNQPNFNAAVEVFEKTYEKIFKNFGYKFLYKNKLIKEISRDSKVSVNGKRKVPFQLP